MQLGEVLRPSSRQLLDSSLSESKVANINAALKQRLGEHPRGRGHLKKLAQLSRRSSLAQLSRRPSSLPHATSLPLPARKTLFSASTVSTLPTAHQRISSSISSSLPSLRHWSDSPLAAEPPSPFVPPQAPHEKLSKSSTRQKGSEVDSDLSSNTGEKIIYLDEDESTNHEGGAEFENWVDPDHGPVILPNEPFVDEYLELIYPTSPGSASQSDGRCSPVSSTAFMNWKVPREVEEPALPTIRRTGSNSLLPGASNMSQASSIVSHAHRQPAAVQKGYRQKVLEQFSTTRRAFDEFIKVSSKKSLGRHAVPTEDYELTEDQFCNFLARHFPSIEEQYYEQIFLFFDQDSGGTISLAEFHRVVSAMNPINCLAGLRCRWIALGFPSVLKALEVMAPRETWATERYDLEQFGSLLSKVGVWTWEEHAYIFGSIAKPGSRSTISIGEVTTALANVSTVLLLEDWRHRFLQMFETLDKAYDKIEVTPGVLTDINAFVVKANEYWKMNRHEAKRLFRLCDFDQREKISRMKFLNTLALAEPSLLHEELRQKVRLHFKKTLTKLRRITGEKTTLDALAPHILNAFASRSTDFLEKRKATPDDFQRTLDHHELNSKDAELLFKLLDIKAKGQEKLTAPCFCHVLKIFAPSCVLVDLNLQCGKIAAKKTSASKEAQKLPAWQARQMGLSRTMPADVAAWLEIAEAKAGESHAEAVRRVAEAETLAPMAVIGPVLRPGSSAGISSPGHLEQFCQRLAAPQLDQVLQQCFSESAAASCTSCLLLDLLEEPMSTESKGSTPGPGLSAMELITALGIAEPDGAGEVFTSEGREAKAQLQARWQYSPFMDFAADLKDGICQRIKQPEQPKPLPVGDSFEPVSYLRSSSLPSIEQQESAASVSGVSASVAETNGAADRAHSEKAYDVRHECLQLIRDDELRMSLHEELLAEERAKPLPYVRRQKGRKPITGPGEAAFMSMYRHLEAVPNYAPPEKLVARLQGYYEEAHTTILSKKQVIMNGLRRSSGKRGSISPPLRSE
eukprot:TRINITY_DN8820_c0_g3_i1.p1 TRINITY_DN8820_c0_g3~~TRINITY_DN8820_c0_g3_i1.p1  ORF type:complete len:1025 (+),score=220.36 TRINITY_DN8820_c0_g3_i1:72-3146(+)